MAFVLTISGILMIVTGARGTYAAFGQQLVSDFTGPGNFTYWVAAVIGVGSLGYIDALRTFSRLFMALIIIAMVLSNQGFFAKFTAALKQGPVAPAANTGNASSSGVSSPSTSSGGSTSGLFGQQPQTSGQAKFNGWMNYFFGSK